MQDRVQNLADPAELSRDHERTFAAFVQLLYVAAAHIANFLLALAVGAVEGHWGAAFFVMALATGLSITSLRTGTKLPLALLTIVALGILGLGDNSLGSGTGA
jgi:hypothetical protein